MTETTITGKDRKRFLKLYPDTSIVDIEPVLNDHTPKWLYVSRKYEMPKDDSDISRMLNGGNDERCFDIKFNIKESGMWICCRCGAEMQSIGNPPLECLESKGGCGKKTNFKQETNEINTDLWKLPIWKDDKDLNMFEVYDELLKIWKRCVVFPEEIFYKIFTLIVISTWKTGYWTSFGFPILLGDPDSGKTRVLDLMRELGYRMIHSAGTTFPAMVRATHFHQAGLLIDEASDRLNPKTESGREMLNFVKPSYREGSRYTAADNNDPEKINSYRNFGFKAFAGERSFTASLISRSITVIMQQADPEIPELYYIQDELNNLQTKLLNYRYKTGPPTDLGMDFVLKGRLREVFGPIISTAMHIGRPYEDIIDFALNIKKEQQEDLIGTLENDILKIIKGSEEKQTTIDGQLLEDAPEYIYYKDLLEKLYPEIDVLDGKEKVEEKRNKGQQIGYAIRRLRLKTKKLHGQNIIPLNNKQNINRLKYLYRKYGMN